VNYNIVRIFAITESGWMELVLKNTNEGDVVVLLGMEKLCRVELETIISVEVNSIMAYRFSLSTSIF
jgi:hypothetical protein